MTRQRPQSAHVLAGAAGLIGLAAALLGLLVAPRALAHAYYAALLGWTLLPLGALGWLAGRHLTGGGWGIALAPALLATTRTLPALALLFLPTLIWPHLFFPWAEPGHALDPAKALWLAPGFFAARTIVYFVVWIVLALVLLGPAGRAERNKSAGAVGLILYFLTGSFAGIDWVMALDSDFSSAIFGMLSVADQMLAGLAWALLVTLLATPAAQAEGARIGALGSLLWGTAMSWAYLEFMQYLVIWSTDLPEKIRYYLLRDTGPWAALLWILAILHAVLPLVLLLPRLVRASRLGLAGIAALLVVTSQIKMIWRAAPLLDQGGPILALLVPALMLGIGGLWMLAFLRGRDRAAPIRRLPTLEGADGR